MNGINVVEKSLTWFLPRPAELKNDLDLVVGRSIDEAAKNPTVMTTHLLGKAFHFPSKQIANLPVT
jgi:hypothetical protein